MKPATPLPWELHHDYGICSFDIQIPEHATADVPQDARYIVHACNNYPKLVEALKAIDYCTSGVDDQFATATERACRDRSKAILRELGELK